jgi:electron transfer flavoprotein beta subunit
LNSIVCITQVPDTESRIKIGADGRSIDETGVKFVVSPYDEYALEEAVKIREAKAAGDVTVVCFGPERAQSAIRDCLARGATKAIHVVGDSLRADSLGIAKVLAAVIRSQPHDLVFVGKQGVGTDNSLVGPMVAELLGIPHVTVVTKLEVGDGKVTAYRETEAAEEVIECSTPALLAAQKGLNNPRFASIKGIMAAKKIAIETKSLADLGLADGDVYEARVKVVSMELPPEKAAGRKIDGSDHASAAKEIVRYLREEVKAF